jgi:hypothetical protein
MAAVCVGAVSRNVISALIDHANGRGVRMTLIVSRTQAEREGFSLGYLGMTTAELMSFVRSRDHGRMISVCRDHAGPYKHPVERGLPPERALASARESILADVGLGFDAIHIDTGDWPSEGTSIDGRGVYQQLCLAAAKLGATANRNLTFEVGFEPQGTAIDDPALFATFVGETLAWADDARTPRPRFIVAQTGTKVSGATNTGELGAAPLQKSLSLLERLAEVARSNDIRIKAHNCDYLSLASWEGLLRCGIWANVAPELGVRETRKVLDLLAAANMKRESDRILEISYASRMWEKWDPGNLPDNELAVLSGHYVFEDPEVIEIKAQLDRQMRNDAGESTDRILQREAAMFIGRLVDLNWNY